MNLEKRFMRKSEKPVLVINRGIQYNKRSYRKRKSHVCTIRVADMGLFGKDL